MIHGMHQCYSMLDLNFNVLDDLATSLCLVLEIPLSPES